MARHITYANVTATLALIIATSGVSYAAGVLPRNSVGSLQLKDDAVTSRKIRSGAVGATDLARSVRAQLDAAGRRGDTGLQGPPGAAGATGPQGPAGSKGDKGDRGLSTAASRHVPNMNGIACGQDVVVGSTRGLLAGSNPETPADPYTAAPGTYVLELVVLSQGPPCAAAKPDFGWNQGAAMGYVLVGSA
jgi:hypothetical protein